MGLSNKTSDWGNFGAYVGGVLSPILSFATIIYLLWTNKNENEKYKKQQKENDFNKMFTLMLEQHNKYIEKPEFIELINDIYDKSLIYINKHRAIDCDKRVEGYKKYEDYRKSYEQTELKNFNKTINKNLFKLIINLKSPTFSNSYNYQFYKTKKLELENNFRTTFEKNTRDK